jgi:TPR repeat protein
MDAREFDSLQQKAEANDSGAMLKLALAFKDGDGTTLDTKKFFEWTAKAADLGNTAAMFELALAYRDGDGTKPDAEKFLEWIEKAAKLGNAEAMFDLALAYRDGDGVETNGDKFFEWIRKAAEAKNAAAMRELAVAYKDGIEVTPEATKTYPDDLQNPDVDRYVEWLKQAVRLDDNEALYMLAIAHKDGTGVPTNDQQFFHWMKRAAARGYSDAMYDLAFAYREGTGIRRSKNSYFKWLAKAAADEEQKDAKLHLAFAYRDGVGVQADNGLFFAQLKEAADAGQKDAKFHLAIAYRDGDVVPASNELFFTWMEAAAKAEIPAAMYHLAMAYWTGTGTAYSFDNFFFWIRRALKAGYSKAFIASELADLQEGNESGALINLNTDLNHLFDEVLQIKKEHVVPMGRQHKYVAHFTTFDALTSMLPEKPSSDQQSNRLRLYNFAYLNDPMEGRRLLDKRMPISRSLADPFFEGGDMDNPISWKAHESSVYVGSFTLRGDELDMWRAYGNDGDGFCVLTPLDAFEQETDEDNQPRHGGEIVKVSTVRREPTKDLPTTLYSIRYKDTQVTKTLERIAAVLKRIEGQREGFGEKKERINRVVRLIVNHILYLYKNDHYETEQEARMLADFDIRADFLRPDERRPARVFVESQDFLFKQKGSQIIIGPRVPDKTVIELNLKYRLSRNNLLDTTEVVRSKLEHLYR